MKLGIHVNSDNHFKELLSIARAAVDKGHSVSVFVMSGGIALLSEREMLELLETQGVGISFCEFNAAQSGINLDTIAGTIKPGSQLDNAIMVRDSDRVISL